MMTFQKGFGLQESKQEVTIVVSFVFSGGKSSTFTSPFNVELYCFANVL